MSLLTSVGTPGYKTPRTAAANDVLAISGSARYVPGYRTIDGSKSRDILQSPTSVLGGGRVMGKITSGGKYRPAYLGVTTAAASSGATSVTVSAALATEMARLIALGGTQSVVFIGPPTAAGTNAVLAAKNCTAASGTTLTVAAIGADIAAGTLVTLNDGSNTFKGIMNQPWGLAVVDEDSASIDVPLTSLLIGGHIDAVKLPDYGNMDASVQAYLKTQLKLAGPFTFTDDTI